MQIWNKCFYDKKKTNWVMSLRCFLWLKAGVEINQFRLWFKQRLDHVAFTHKPTSFLLNSECFRWNWPGRNPRSNLFITEPLRKDCTQSAKKQSKTNSNLIGPSQQDTAVDGGGADTDPQTSSSWVDSTCCSNIRIPLLCSVCEPSLPQLTANILFYFYGDINSSD